MALNLTQMQYNPLRQQQQPQHGISMKNDIMMSSRREPFQPRIPTIDMPNKNYMLKRDVLPNLASLSIRSDSPIPHSSDSNSSGSENNSPQKQGSVNSSRYKTEMCRPFEEQGFCKYSEKCQFAHGIHELRNLARHPKYKTELCRTYHTVGFCPYGPRCHFVHNDEDAVTTGPPKQAQPVNKPASMDSAVRNLFSSWEYSPYQSSNGALHNQLSVSLGSAGDYSPPSSLSTSPILSPAFSDDYPSPIACAPPVHHTQLTNQVWPQQHTSLSSSLASTNSSDQFLHSSLQLNESTYDYDTTVHRALVHDFRMALIRNHAARLEAMIPEHDFTTSVSSLPPLVQQTPVVNTTTNTNFLSDHCISTTSEDYSTGATPQMPQPQQNCPESPLRLPIFRRISVEEQAAAAALAQKL